MPGYISSPSQNARPFSHVNSEQQRIERKKLAERSLTVVEKIQQFIEYVKGLIYEEQTAIGDVVVFPPNEDQKKRAKEMGVHGELVNANKAENALNYSDDDYVLKTTEVLNTYLDLWRGNNTERSYKDEECFYRIKQGYGEPIALFIRGKIASLTIKVSKKMQELTFKTNDIHTVDDYLAACAELSFWKIKPESRYYFYKKIPGDQGKMLVLDEKTKLDLAQVQNKFPSKALCINYLQEQEAFHFIRNQYEADSPSVEVDSSCDQHPITSTRTPERHSAKRIDLVSTGHAGDSQTPEDSVRPFSHGVPSSEWPSFDFLQNYTEQRPTADVKPRVNSATLAYEDVDRNSDEPSTPKVDLLKNGRQGKSLWSSAADQLLLPDTKTKASARSDRASDVADIELYSKPSQKKVVVSEKLEQVADENNDINRLGLVAVVKKDQQESRFESPTKLAEVEQGSAGNSEPDSASGKEQGMKVVEKPIFQATGVQSSPRIGPLLHPNLDSFEPLAVSSEQRDGPAAQVIHLPTAPQAIPKEPTRLETITNKLLLKIEGESTVNEESIKNALDPDERSFLQNEFEGKAKLAAYYKGLTHASRAQKAINDVKNSSAPSWLSTWWNSARIDEALIASRYASINGVAIQRNQLDLVKQVIAEKREANYHPAYKLLLELNSQSKEIKDSEVQNGLAFFKQYAKECYERAKGSILEPMYMDLAVEFNHPEACMERARSFMQQAEEDAQVFVRIPAHRQNQSTYHLSDAHQYPGLTSDYGVSLASDPVYATREAKLCYSRVVNHCAEDEETRPMAAEAAFKLAFLIQHVSSGEVKITSNKFYIKKAIELGSEEAKKFEQFANSTSTTKAELSWIVLEVAKIYTDRVRSGKGTEEDSHLAITLLKTMMRRVYNPEAHVCLYYLRSLQAKNDHLIDLTRKDVMALGDRALKALKELTKAANEASDNDDYLKKKNVEKKYEEFYNMAEENMMLKRG